MKTQSEQELAKDFIAFFQDQDMYFEVPVAGGIIDIVVKTDLIITAIEVKTCFNFAVLEQAIRNKRFAHYSYIAVPKGNKRWFQEQVCKDYGVGLLESWNGYVSEIVRPKLNRKVVRISIEQYHKESVAGSQNERMTAFKNFVKQLQLMAIRYPAGIEFNDIFKTGYSHYSSVSSLKSCVSQYVSRGIITGIKIENGRIYPVPNTTPP
ncbi:hypothetical protein DYBT9275_02711 [Dyadobacter sp. CECT 9275]|uniref:Uncharacterized protein n=1 Tax=Dyadobacter helix TaxID=2822344 RepID=A0A916JC97_9BACT|nr:hypothetical protein [Dyadobacter sp. CECT 9275]CAG5001645.1 hypothetical protein DYBT9275_02711 [Dyadobacter sp. CECT 9275]